MTDDEYIAALSDFQMRRREHIRLAKRHMDSVMFPQNAPPTWEEAFELNAIRIAAEAALKPWRTE